MNSETAKENDIVEITGKAEFNTIEKGDKVKKVLDIPVKCNGLDLKYTPGFKSLKKLQEIFGTEESDNWVGKKFLVKIKEIESFGKEMKVIRPEAIEEKSTAEVSRD